MAIEGFGVPSEVTNTEPKKKRPVPRRLKRGGVEVCRILPPLKSGLPGTFIKFIRVHWGYGVPKPNDPTQSTMIPLLCPRTNTMNGPCALCDAYDRKKKAFEETEAKCKAKQMSADETATVLAPLKEWLDRFNSDGKWYLNVMNQKGEFYPFMINTTTKKTLFKRFDELKRIKIAPMDPDKGVWFRFEERENGKNNEVVVVQDAFEGDDGSVSFKIKFAPLSEEQQREALTVSSDLLVDIARAVPAEKLEMLANCSGEPEDVFKILGATEKVAAPSAPVHDEEYLNQFRG